MSEPQIGIEKRRIDSEDHAELLAMARGGADRFGWRAELAIDAELAELLRLRVAQMNRCTYCLELHNRVARDLGIGQARIDTLSGWRQTALFSEPERAALAYTEALTAMSDAAISDFQTFHDDLARHFDETEVLEIIGIVINMNIWTRLKLAEGATPVVTEG